MNNNSNVNQKKGVFMTLRKHRGVFMTLSIIYDEAFLRKIVKG